MLDSKRRKLLEITASIASTAALVGTGVGWADVSASPAPSPPGVPAPSPAPAPAPAPPPAMVWNVGSVYLTTGGGSAFDLRNTLPAGVIRGGVFSVDRSGAALPAGVSLSSVGILIASSSAQIGNVSGVVFAYDEP